MGALRFCGSPESGKIADAVAASASVRPRSLSILTDEPTSWREPLDFLCFFVFRFALLLSSYSVLFQCCPAACNANGAARLACLHIRKSPTATRPIHPDQCAPQSPYRFLPFFKKKQPSHLPPQAITPQLEPKAQPHTSFTHEGGGRPPC